MTRVLLVEDDSLIGEMIRLNLQQDGYEVQWLKRGDGAVERASDPDLDLIVLDVMLPGPSGFEIARGLRQARVETPILMLTARSDTSSKVTGLDAGADDYLTKPFDMAELLARIRALLRRGPREVAAPQQVHLGSCVVDLQTGRAETGQGSLELAPAELRLLELFVHRRGQVLRLEDILEELATDDATDVKQCITRLRSLFEPDPERPRYFVSVHSGGYRFEN